VGKGEEWKDRILDKKWKALEKLGITKPINEDERIRRLDEANRR
jgi:hypothetical protein